MEPIERSLSTDDAAIAPPLRGVIRADAPPPKSRPRASGLVGLVGHWAHIIYEPIGNWFDDRCVSLSASIAFFSAFSLAPTLVLILVIISVFYGADAAQGKLVGEIRGVVGDQAAAGIQSLITSAWQTRTGTKGTTLISILIVVVGASATFSSLNTALNQICPPPGEIEGTTASIISLIRTRLISFGLVIASGFVVVFLLLLDAIINFAGTWLLGIHSPAFVIAHYAQRSLSFFILLGAFTALLKLMPDASIHWRSAFLGGLTSALLFTGGKNIFGFYLAHAGTANSFGAAGSLAVVLMWLYYSAAVFLLGAEVTASNARAHGLLGPHPRGLRRARRRAKILPRRR